MEFWLIFIGSAIFFLFIRGAWRAYTDPSHVLGRQGANMGWVISGHQKDAEGYRNVVLVRGSNEAVISFSKGHVELIKPYHSEPFKDFVELERWFVKKGITPSSIEPKEELNASVRNEFMLFIESHGFKEKYLEVCKYDNVFGLAVSELREAGRNADASEKVIAAFVVDALHNYDKSPQFALKVIEDFTNQYLNEPSDGKEYSGAEIENEDSDYHSDLDELNEEIINWLETYDLINRSNGDNWPINVWSEILAYVGSYLARSSHEQKIYDVEWNSFKASIENRILSSLENPPNLNGVKETQHGAAFVHYVSEYHSEMSKLEKLIGNKILPDGSADLRPVSEYLSLKMLGKQEIDKSADFEELLSDIEAFASDRVIPKVVQAFS